MSVRAVRWAPVLAGSILVAPFLASAASAQPERGASEPRMRAIHEEYVFADIHAHPSRFHRANVDRIGADEIARYQRGFIDLVVANDMISIWTTRSGWEGSKEGTEMRRRLGVDFTELSSDEILDLEPAIRLRPHRGLRFTGARHLRDPQAFVTRLYQRFLDLGGTWRQDAVDQTEPRKDGVTVHLGRETVSAGRVVITAGAHSKSVKGSGTEGLPLETERGYHLVYKDHGSKISRPVGWNEGGFYTTPTDGGLRMAGTVEINRINAPMNRRRLAYIARRGAELWGQLDGPVEEWMGFRPTFPDSLPVIGPSPASDRIILAYGHQHLGLTLGGITGRIVTDLAEGRSPNLPIDAFSPDRF